MDQRIQEKLAEYKKKAKSQGGNVGPKTRSTRIDSLSQVIRSKKEADIFMAELESAFERAK